MMDSKTKEHKLKIELAKHASRIQKIKQAQGGEETKMKITLPRFSWDKEKDVGLSK